MHTQPETLEMFLKYTWGSDITHFLINTSFHGFLTETTNIQVQTTDSKRNLAGLLLWMGEKLNGKYWGKYGPTSFCDYDS